MINKSANLSMILVVTILISACSSEEKQFSELLSTNDLSKTYEFKSKYPKSIFNVDSLIQVLEYSEVSKTNNVTAIKEFISKYRHSEFGDSAQTRLYLIEWENINEYEGLIVKKDEIKVREYIKNYP